MLGPRSGSDALGERGDVLVSHQESKADPSVVQALTRSLSVAAVMAVYFLGKV